MKKIIFILALLIVAGCSAKSPEEARESINRNLNNAEASFKTGMKEAGDSINNTLNNLKNSDDNETVTEK